MTFIQIQPGARCTLADGRLAYERGTRRVTATDIERHGSYEKARRALDRAS